MSTRGAVAADSAPKNGRSAGASASSVPAKPLRSRLATLCMPNGRSSRPSKLTRTPWPRAVGLAAKASASRRFLGPSASAASALRIAPVNSTGASPR
jgi:hypothetical protein